MARPRLTYANVASTLAVVLAMSGTAVAVATIDGSSITNRSIAGKKLIKDTVTGTEVKESTLGKVPNADKLDGLDATGFVKGSNARVLTRSARLASTADSEAFTTVYTLPGFGPLAVQCSAGGNHFQFRYHNATTSRQQYAFTYSYYENTNADSVFTYGDFVDADGIVSDGITNVNASRGFHIELTVIRSSGTHYAEITLTGVTQTDGTEYCDYAATAVVR